MEHVVRNACENESPQTQSAEGTTENPVVPSALLMSLYNNAGVPCFALHRLPIFCRHYVTLFFKTLQNRRLYGKPHIQSL